MGKMARLFSGMRAGSSVRVGASGGRFSPADIEVGPGYLVHGDNLHYQKNGRQQFARSLQTSQDAPTRQRFVAQLASGQPHMARGTNAQSQPQAL